MIRLPDFSAIIFDMDGLVLDTEKTYAIAWQQAAREMGESFSDEFCNTMSGLQAADVEKRLLAACAADFDMNRFFQLSSVYWREYVNKQGIPVKKGFHRLLELLKSLQIPYCLATNSGEKNARECLHMAGLANTFSIIISSDQVKQGKPAPDIFLSAAAELDRPVSKCLVLEDSPTGIQAARNAQAPAIYIPSVLPYDKVAAEQADLLINDLDELVQIFQSLALHPV